MAEYISPFIAAPDAKQNPQVGPGILSSEIKELSGALDKLIKSFPDLNRFGKSLLYEDFVNKFQDSTENQSDIFKALTDVQNNIMTSVLETESRGQAKLNKAALEGFESQIKDYFSEGEITEEEEKFFKEMIFELKRTNKQLLETDYSIKNVLKDSIKSKLPSISGVLGAIGLDNPAFLFLGHILQDVFDKQKEKKEKTRELLAPVGETYTKKVLEDKGFLRKDSEEVKEVKEKSVPVKKEQEQEMVGLANDIMETLSKPEGWSTEIIDGLYERFLSVTQAITDTSLEGSNTVKQAIEISNDRLSNIESGIDILTKDAQGSKFAEIERAREDQIRHDEMINALGGDGTGPGLLPPEEEEDKKGIFSGILDSINNFILYFTVFGKKLAKFGKVIRIGAKFLGPVIAALDFAFGAFKGWTNAAEKLGKDVADLTITDKISSAIGGGLGQIASIADSILGLFGFSTDIQGWVDEKATELSLALFDRLNKIKDFFFNIFDISFPEGFSLTEMVKAPYRLLKGWFAALFDLELPEIEDLLSLDKIKSFATNILDKIMNLVLDQLAKIPGLGKITEKFRSNKDEVDPIKELIETGGIEKKGMFKDSEINDWEKVKKLNADQVQEIINMDDWDKTTTDMLNRILKEKQDFVIKQSDKDQLKFVGINEQGDLKLAPNQPKLDIQEQRTNTLYDTSLKEASAPKQSSSGTAVINAPRTTVNNSSNTSSSTYTPLSPREVDLTLRTLQNQYSY